MGRTLFGGPVIYFIHATDTDRVKIGYTGGDPLKRMADLQTGSSHKLTLLSTVEGTQADESRIHREHAADRLAGEWFRLSVSLMVRIAGNELDKKQASINAGIQAIYTEREANRIEHLRQTAEYAKVRETFAAGKAAREQAAREKTANELPTKDEAAEPSASLFMKCEKRHHLGHADIHTPFLVCCVCNRQILSVMQGNAFWNPKYDVSEEVFYRSRWPVVFAHKECSTHQKVSVPSFYCSMPLNVFVAFLVRGLGMKIECPAAETYARV